MDAIQLLKKQSHISQVFRDGLPDDLLTCPKCGEATPDDLYTCVMCGNEFQNTDVFYCDNCKDHSVPGIYCECGELLKESTI